jgi:hypothetical protein
MERRGGSPWPPGAAPPDDSLDRSLETEVPEHIRKQAEAYARSLQGNADGTTDPAVVHAIISEWMRMAVHQARLVPSRT